MATLNLEPRCLHCGNLVVFDTTETVRNGAGEPVAVTGEITCIHFPVCVHIGAFKTIGEIVADLEFERESMKSSPGDMGALPSDGA